MAENKTRLVEVGLEDGRWTAEDAYWALNEGWDLSEMAQDEAEKLKCQVMSGAITIDELRGGVRWANALEKEAVEMYCADLSIGDQIQERVARRLMHLAGATALKGLRSRRLRTIATARVSTQRRMPGMGNLETHDR
ncbi:MAG: hypothetical protein U0520_00585 [Candidatus Saccharimonadales bacterium]